VATRGETGADHVGQIMAGVRNLRDATGRLPSERDLARRLDVKRHQLRKALTALRQAGELDPLPARQPQPAAPAQPRYGDDLVRLTSPIEVLELRLILEPSLARLASLRASAVDIARIHDAATTPPGADAGAADLAFHFAVIGAARNHLADELYKIMRQVGYDARVKTRMAASGCPTRIARRDAEHLAVAEAIAARDPDAAESAMRAHLASVRQQINQHSNGSVAA
jgi:DNA-binding FadR family transcriptional regulator